MDEPAEPSSRPVVRVEVVRSGGFAGVRRTWCVEADDADDWPDLVAACPWGRVSMDAASRDRFVWRIDARVEGRRRRATVPDRDLTGPWRALVDRVQQDGSEPPSGGAG